MALIQLGPVRFDADLVVFDKDGTLIDLDSMWGPLAEAWTQHLAADSGDPSLSLELYRSLGYDPQQRRVIPQSPLAIATTAQLQTISANVLYRHGMSWTESEERTKAAFQIRDELPLTSLIHPLGDVAGLFQQLRDSGIRIGVVTTDHRAETEETLRVLGIEPLIDHLVCGDEGIPWKPAPDALLFTCETLGVEPARTVVVGDMVADLLMARAAGAGLSVGVLSGAGKQAELATHADVLLHSIQEIVAAANHALGQQAAQRGTSAS